MLWQTCHWNFVKLIYCVTTEICIALYSSTISTGLWTYVTCPPNLVHCAMADSPVISLFAGLIHPSVELSDVPDGSDVRWPRLGLLQPQLRLPGSVDGRGRPPVWGVRHLEDHLHVVGGAGAADPPVEVRPGAGGDEVIVLARVELQTPRTGTEWPAMEKMLTRWQTQILWLIYGYRPLLTTRKYLQNSHSCNCKIYS